MSNPLRALEHENHELKCRLVDQEANRLRIRELEAQVEKLECENKFHFSMMMRYMDFIQSKGYQREYINNLEKETEMVT